MKMICIWRAPFTYPKHLGVAVGWHLFNFFIIVFKSCNSPSNNILIENLIIKRGKHIILGDAELENFGSYPGTLSLPHPPVPTLEALTATQPGQTSSVCCLSSVTE